MKPEICAEPPQGPVMFAEQRRLVILNQLEQDGSVRVANLAGHLDVAVETIRRDLEQLEREGKLTRTHGGAVPRASDHDTPFAQRRSANHDAKVRIARRAAEFIQAGEVVAFDASSTVYELVRVLPQVSLAVVTNALPVLTRLCGHEEVRVFCIGGTLDIPSRSMVGPFAEEVLGRLNVKKLFLSSKGVDLVRGLSEHDAEHARVKRQLMDVAEEVYLLADHSKLNSRAAVHIAEITEVTTLVTDALADTQFLADARAQGIHTEVVD